MATYSQSLRVLQPIIDPIYTALRKGLGEATQEHTRRKLDRRDDAHYYLHSARRAACEELNKVGLHARLDDGRPRVPLSGVMILHAGVALRLLRPSVTKKGAFQIPVPGRSASRQRFWRQEPTIPGILECDNLLLLWTDEKGDLRKDMELVRPLGGDHRRKSLRLHWAGPFNEGMAKMRAADLELLKPRYQSDDLWNIG